MRAAGINPLSVDYWISTLDGAQSVSIPAGGKQPVAIQYVDTGAYDESIILDPEWVGDDMFTQADRDALNRILGMLANGTQSVIDPNTGEIVPVPSDWPEWLPATLKNIQASIPTSGTALTTEQAQQLSNVDATVSRIENGLKGA